MKFDSIYLVANLAKYDFANVILLADDVGAIAAELVGATDADLVRHCEQALFLGHVLATALEASRRVVGNGAELEELLRVNWADDPDADRKWELVRESDRGGVVNRVAARVLMVRDGGGGGETCLGLVKAFYKKFSCKAEFRRMLDDVRRELVWREAAWNYLCLKGSVQPEVGKVMESLAGIEKKDGDARAALENSARWDLPSLVLAYNCGTVSSEKFNRTLAGILVLLQAENEDFCEQQLRAVRKLAQSPEHLESYQDLMGHQPFYEVNLELLRAHHRKLLKRDIPYDSTVILLCHLIYAKAQNGQFLRDFLNEATLGCTSNLELILAELQNFS